LSQRLAKLRQTWEKIEIPSLKLFIFFNFFFLEKYKLKRMNQINYYYHY
jgi:hypothetical protein